MFCENTQHKTSHPEADQRILCVCMHTGRIQLNKCPESLTLGDSICRGNVRLREIGARVVVPVSMCSRDADLDERCATSPAPQLRHLRFSRSIDNRNRPNLICKWIGKQDELNRSEPFSCSGLQQPMESAVPQSGGGCCVNTCPEGDTEHTDQPKILNFIFSRALSRG